MIITVFLQTQRDLSHHYTILCKEFLKETASVCFNTIANDYFASNLTIALEFLNYFLQTDFETAIFDKLFDLLEKSCILGIINNENYSRMHYLV